jgi:hypothetical protein
MQTQRTTIANRKEIQDALLILIAVVLGMLTLVGLVGMSCTRPEPSWPDVPIVITLSAAADGGSP